MLQKFILVGRSLDRGLCGVFVAEVSGVEFTGQLEFANSNVKEGSVDYLKRKNIARTLRRHVNIFC